MTPVSNLPTSGVDSRTAKGVAKNGPANPPGTALDARSASFDDLLDSSAQGLLQAQQGDAAAPNQTNAATRLPAIEPSNESNAATLVPQDLLQVLQTWFAANQHSPNPVNTSEFMRATHELRANVTSEGYGPIASHAASAPRRAATDKASAQVAIVPLEDAPTKDIFAGIENRTASHAGTTTTEGLAPKPGPAPLVDAGALNEVSRAFHATSEVRNSAPAHALLSTHVAASVHSPEWVSAFGEQVVMQARTGEQRAELRLNPAELGPIEVSLQTYSDRVHAVFSIAHSATLEAVQNALPKLEQMLSEQGLTLESVSVDARDARDNQRAQQRFEGDQRAHGGVGGSGDELEEVQRMLTGRMGLVDIFA